MNEDVTKLGAYLLAMYGQAGLKGPLFPDAEKWAEEDRRLRAERQLRSQIYAHEEDIKFAEDVIEAAKNDELRDIMVIAVGWPYLDMVARDVLRQFPDAKWNHRQRMIRIGDRRIDFKLDDDLRHSICGRSWDKILFHPLVSWPTYVAQMPSEQPTGHVLR